MAVLISALNSFSSGDGSSGFLLGLRAGRAFSWEEDTASVPFSPGIQLSCSRQAPVPHPSCARLSFPVEKWTQQQDLHSLTLPFLLKYLIGVNKFIIQVGPKSHTHENQGLIIDRVLVDIKSEQFLGSEKAPLLLQGDKMQRKVSALGMASTELRGLLQDAPGIAHSAHFLGLSSLENSCHK